MTLRGRYGTLPTKIKEAIASREGGVIKKMITEDKFKAYVEVQTSGVTNMFNVPVVMSLSGLTKEECLDIMKSYGKYREQFKENINDQSRE